MGKTSNGQNVEIEDILNEIEDIEEIEGNDDSTIIGESESSFNPISNKKKSVYRTFDTVEGYERRRPFFLSRNRVKNRKIMIYKEKMWNKEDLEKCLDVIDKLEMKKVCILRNAKFIVIDWRMFNDPEVEEELVRLLAIEVLNGCRAVRE